MVNTVSNKYSKEELMDRAFYRIAWNIYHMWVETGSSDTRLFLEPLIPEEFIIVGKSKKGGDWKEHVVPRMLLCNQCHQMYSEGASIEDVAHLIKNNLKIVLIAKFEQEHLDNVLGYKQNMPPTWTFSDGNPYQRLEDAGIKWEKIA